MQVNRETLNLCSTMEYANQFKSQNQMFIKTLNTHIKNFLAVRVAINIKEKDIFVDKMTSINFYL